MDKGLHGLPLDIFCVIETIYSAFMRFYSQQIEQFMVLPSSKTSQGQKKKKRPQKIKKSYSQARWWLRSKKGRAGTPLGHPFYTQIGVNLNIEDKIRDIEFQICVAPNWVELDERCLR